MPHISVRRTLLLVVTVALAATASAGAVYAAHNFFTTDGNVLACVNHNRGVITVIVDGSACTLDREVTVELALRGGTVANADNAATLDGIDSTGFLRSDTYEKSVSSSGNAVPGGFMAASLFCESGDLFLSGGFLGVDPGTHISAAVKSGQGYQVRWLNDDTADSITIVTVCANQ